MKISSGYRLGSILFFVFLFVSLVLATPRPVEAVIAGSRHGFGTAVDPGGDCSACHLPHNTKDTQVLWSRDLTEERGFFEDAANLPSGQDYTWNFTLLCYDCHDNHDTLIVDNTPDDANFTTNPHDVAFDVDLESVSYGTWDGVGASQPAGAGIGYFEDRYEGGTDPTMIAGHYFMSVDPDGIGGDRAQDDKLPCKDCHDPHGKASPSNESFIKASLGTGLTASTNTRYGTGDGRAICAACHGYGNITGDEAAWSAVNPSYTVGGTITATPGSNDPGPGENVAAHTSTGSGACTLCHSHQNPVDYTNCYKCHSVNAEATWSGITAALGAAAKFVDGTSGDSIGHTEINSSRHNITFTVADSSDCLVCHEFTSGDHADGDTSNDLSDPDGDGIEWLVSSASETENSFGRLIEYCLDCHDGGAGTWFSGSLTAPNVNLFIDVGPDGKSTDDDSSTKLDDVSNAYGEVDPDWNVPPAGTDPYEGNSPTFYDTATGAGHDPPLGYTGVPMFAHYTQNNTSATTGEWWKLGATSTQPQPLPCLDCHYAHGSPNQALYRSPKSPTPSTNLQSEVNLPREICLDCHDGTSTLEGITVPDPVWNPGLRDRNDRNIPAHNSSSPKGCTPNATNPNNGCHNPHAPSCEICHSYPPPS